MQDVGADAGVTCGPDHRLNGGRLGSGRPRPQERGVVGAAGLTEIFRVLCMHEQHAAELSYLGCRLAQPGWVQWRELRHARVGQEAFEAVHAGPVQAPAIRLVAWHRTTPDGNVDPALPGRSRALHL